MSKLCYIIYMHMYVYNFLYGNAVFMSGCVLAAIREHWQWLNIF